MAIYSFINGERKRAFTYNPRVRVNGTMKKIIEGYVFINGVRHKLFDRWSFEHTEIYTENATESLPFGTYQIICRGAGGAGGETGSGSNQIAVGGIGGAGAKGKIEVYDIVLSSVYSTEINVGTAGLTKANGGNGGNGGYAVVSVATGGPGGAGGGGGKPSYVKIGDSYYIANGGGGGGGGGGAGTAAWLTAARGAGGGGGGGYYKLELVDGQYTLVDIAGKNGADQQQYAGANGIAGNTTDFPNIKSGKGGNGNSNYYTIAGGSSANGGGASGASGGGWGQYVGDGASGGGGGGGAGGTDEAGGGAAGAGGQGGSENGSNHFTTPINTTSENAQYGVNANYGMGGTTNQNGSKGFVVIKRIA